MDSDKDVCYVNFMQLAMGGILNIFLHYLHLVLRILCKNISKILALMFSVA